MVLRKLIDFSIKQKKKKKIAITTVLKGYIESSILKVLQLTFKGCLKAINWPGKIKKISRYRGSEIFIA